MYIHPSSLDEKFIGFEWKSKIHRQVAENSLLCNREIKTKDTLVDQAKIINEIPEDRIELVTFKDLMNKGILIPFIEFSSN